ncbi:TolC family protein [Parasulfuritortus cantonensis]|uniref:TolC family protein n=1 Tax=Parasulfuritortus cantonensis TaxID=2528202 RepID=A0A4R1BE10_9PROT|nr:TolC family protein [Parasulfuritortus cantonensis]TCJ15331.1 TolC family protein [Parasulfuritortus cantonensis]
MRRLIASFGLALALNAGAADEPLTLEQALAYADQPHPDLGLYQAEVDLAKAQELLAESQNDFRVTLAAGLRSGRNSLNHDGFESDNLASLNARKTIWDGGRTELATAAARLESAGRVNRLLDARAQRRLALMTRFFDVLATDLQYAADSEFTAVAYVNWDNAKDRQQVGELSSVQMADLEARFQEARVKRNDTLRQARAKRALLAAAMNRPGELPAELADPVLRGNDRALPEFKDLLAALEANSPLLQAQRQLLEASRQRLQAQRAENRPSLDVEAETATYSRETATRDNLRAGLNLTWPLWQGRRVDAAVAVEQARFQSLQAQYDRLLLDLRQALFETREEIAFLVESERPAARANAAMADWNLERARAEYELELKTTLGTSMADSQRARMRSKAAEYRLALAWARLDALVGQPCCQVASAEAGR